MGPYTGAASSVPSWATTSASASFQVATLALALSWDATPALAPCQAVTLAPGPTCVLLQLLLGLQLHFQLLLWQALSAFTYVPTPEADNVMLCSGVMCEAGSRQKWGKSPKQQFLCWLCGGRCLSPGLTRFLKVLQRGGGTHPALGPKGQVKGQRFAMRMLSCQGKVAAPASTDWVVLQAMEGAPGLLPGLFTSPKTPGTPLGRGSSGSSAGCSLAQVTCWLPQCQL